MNIKEHREKLGLSQREYAERFRVNERTLQRIEAGVSQPSALLIRVIELDERLAELEQETRQLREDIDCAGERAWRRTAIYGKVSGE